MCRHFCLASALFGSWLLLTLLTACTKPEERTELATSPNTVIEKPVSTKQLLNDSTKRPEIDCEDASRVMRLRFPDDSLRAAYIDQILSKDTRLTTANRQLLSDLKVQDRASLVINSALFPVFKLSVSEFGVFAFPQYYINKHGIDYVSSEDRLATAASEVTESATDNYTKTVFYPSLLDSLYANKEKPVIHYYAVSDIGLTRIADFGIHLGECLEYYIYSFDTTYRALEDSVLFGSKLPIDLIYESSPKIDSLLGKKIDVNCIDCPDSFHLARTFARLSGSDRVFFVYADTFLTSNKLDTPLRGLVYINEEAEVVYLWQENVDLFGCSCL